MGFSLPLNESSLYEIIVGNNDAAETKMALEQLKPTNKDFIIQFAGKKIVIAAKTELALEEACNVFIETYVGSMTNASASSINSFVTELSYLGYKKTEDNSIGGNRFVTCYGECGVVHISYLASKKSVTVILDSLKNSVYKTSEPSYTKVTDTSLALMSIDYTLSGTGNAQTQNLWLAKYTTCYVADGKIEVIKFVGGTNKISVTTCNPNTAK